MKALVVDDEAPARRRLARMLRELPGIESALEVEDGEALLASVEELAPDVIFLDIRMPGIDGITLAQNHPELPPVVFTTAYDEYAVRAFEVDAVDYLVKPVRPERLAAALERVRARSSPVAAGKAVRVTSTARGMIEVFDPSLITRFWSSQKYTLFLVDGEERLTEEPLLALETRLAGHGFLRVHRGELVRIDAVRALRVILDGHEAILSDGQHVRVSRRSVALLKQRLSHLTD
jgi:DNA-binding LytR/AlgR family response regulator